MNEIDGDGAMNKKEMAKVLVKAGLVRQGISHMRVNFIIPERNGKDAVIISGRVMSLKGGGEEWPAVTVTVWLDGTVQVRNKPDSLLWATQVQDADQIAARVIEEMISMIRQNEKNQCEALTA